MWSKLNPAIPRHWLYAIAGAVWTAVGLMLDARALSWIGTLPAASSLVMLLGGIVAALVVYVYAFRKIVNRNIRRISDLPEKACLFAFTAWSGYIIIGFMVTLGYVLRNSPIPKYFLIVPYAAMGVVLLLGSVNYYREFYLEWSAGRAGRDGLS